MHIIRKLASETAIYGLSSVLGRVLNYFLVPLYTSILLPAEYGLLTELYAYAAFGNILYTFGLETAYFRFAEKGQESVSFNTATSILLVISLIWSACLILLAQLLVHKIGYPNHTQYIYYLVAIMATDSILAIPFARLRLQKKALFFAGCKLFQISLNILFNGLLLYQHRHTQPNVHIAAILLANLLANAAVIPLLIKTWSNFRFRLPWTKVKAMFIYAFPLLLMGLAGTANEMLSRILLKYLLPPGFYPGYSNAAVLGIFGACYKLSVFMSLAIQAFKYAAEPFFFQYGHNQNAPQLFNQVMQAYIMVACFILLSITANLDWLAYLFLRNPVYRTGIEIVPYLLFAYLWLGVYYNLSVWFKLTDKTYYGTWITSIGTFIMVITNFCLVPYWGYWGSVWATIASYMAMAILSYYLGQKHYPIPYSLKSGLIYLVMTFGLVPILRSIPYTDWYSNMIVNGVFTVCLGWLLYQFVYRRSIKKFI